MSLLVCRRRKNPFKMFLNLTSMVNLSPMGKLISFAFLIWILHSLICFYWKTYLDTVERLMLLYLYVWWLHMVVLCCVRHLELQMLHLKLSNSVQFCSENL